MTSRQCEQGTSSNQDTLRIDLEMLINKIPIVYTTKLDDMWIFHRNIKNIPKGDLVDIILCESLPVFNSLPSVKPEEKDNTNFNDLKLKLSKLFSKKRKNAPLKSKNTDLKRRKKSNSNSKEKSNETKSDFECQFDPSIESNSSDNINVITIDCNGVQTMSTLRDLEYPLKDIELTIYDRTFNEHDVYVLDTDGLISEHHRVIECDVKLNKTNYNKKKVVMDFCCWVQRNKCVNSMYPSCVSLPTLKFMLKSHKCLPNRCVCCCREGDVDEIRTSTEASDISESKDVISQDAENIFLHKDWLEDLKSNKKSCSKFIDRALWYNGIPTIKTNIERQTKKTKIPYCEKYNRKVKLMKHEKEYKIIYEFNANDGNLISQNRILSANYYTMHPKPLYLKQIKQPKRYSGCCWYDYNRIEKNLMCEELNNIAKHYRRPHLCPIDYCECCCKTKCNNKVEQQSVPSKKINYTNPKYTAPQKVKRSSKKKSTNKKSLGTASSASSTNYEKMDSDMTVTLLTKRSKQIWEKFEHLRIIVTDEGKVSARVPRFSSLSTEEVQALTKILSSAEEVVQRQSLQPGTRIDVRMSDQNDDCLKIALELVYDNDGIENVCEDIQGQEQKNAPLDIEEQIVPRFFDSVKDDNNHIEHQIEDSRKTICYDTYAEQQDLEMKKEITNIQDRDLSQTIELEAIIQDNIFKENQTTTPNDDFTVGHLHGSDLKNEPTDMQEHVVSPLVVFVKSEINDNNNIKNLNGLTEPKDNSQHQASTPKNYLTDITQEQVILPTLPPAAFECVIEDSNDMQNVIHNIQEPENNLLVAKHNTAEPTILNFKLDEAERTSNVIGLESNNITYVIQQPSTKPVLIPFSNIAPNEHQDCQIGLPRIETIYSMQSVDESTQFTTVTSNNKEADNMKSAPKRKSDVQSNLPPKIRVVSPSKLGVVYGTDDKESNDSTPVHRNYRKQNISAIDTTKYTIVKVTSEPNISSQTQNKKIGEAPKYVKILPKPPKLDNKKSGTGSTASLPKKLRTNLSKANGGSKPSASSSKPLNMPKAYEGFVPSKSWLNMGKSVSQSPRSKKTKRKIIKIVLNPNDYLQTATKLSTVNSNDETETINVSKLEELTTMHICETQTPQSSTLHSNYNEVTAAQLGIVNSYDVAPQLSSLSSIIIDNDVAAAELGSVSSFDVDPQSSSLNSIIIDGEVTAEQLSSLNSIIIDDQVTAEQLSSLNSIIIDGEVTADQLSSLNSIIIDDQVTAEQLSSLNSIIIDGEVTAEQLSSLNSIIIDEQVIAEESSSLNSIIIDDEETAAEFGSVNSCDVPRQLSTVNSDISNKVTAPKLTTVNSFEVAQLSRVSSNENVKTENSILPNKKILMTNKSPNKKSKRPIILKKRSKYC